MLYVSGRNALCTTLAFVGVALMSTASASAATVGGPTMRASSEGVQYQANDDASHDIEATSVGGVITIIDHGATSFDHGLPNRCTAHAVPDGVGADCRVGDGRKTLTIRLGAGDDFVAASDLPRNVGLDVQTGDGINAVEGGSGDDRITGGDDGDTLYGGPGWDVVRGGGGFNFMHGNSGDDIIVGGDDMDFIFGDSGSDAIEGRAELDFIYGGAGNDVIDGGKDGDLLSGGSGNDDLYGSQGDDDIRGGTGNDRLNGGLGDDVLRARDGITDVLDCGTGNDVARVDAGEVDRAKRSCDTVLQADPTVVDPEDQDDVLDESIEEAVDVVDDGEDRREGRSHMRHRPIWFHAR